MAQSTLQASSETVFLLDFLLRIYANDTVTKNISCIYFFEMLPMYLMKLANELANIEIYGN